MEQQWFEDRERSGYSPETEAGSEGIMGATPEYTRQSIGASGVMLDLSHARTAVAGRVTVGQAWSGRQALVETECAHRRHGEKSFLFSAIPSDSAMNNKPGKLHR